MGATVMEMLFKKVVVVVMQVLTGWDLFTIGGNGRRWRFAYCRCD